MKRVKQSKKHQHWKHICPHCHGQLRYSVEHVNSGDVLVFNSDYFFCDDCDMSFSVGEILSIDGDYDDDDEHAIR